MGSFPSEGDLYAVEHQYSCGGYWLAQDWGDSKFWRKSPAFGQGSVLSRYQALMIGEKLNVPVHFVSCLPTGAVVLNAR